MGGAAHGRFQNAQPIGRQQACADSRHNDTAQSQSDADRQKVRHGDIVALKPQIECAGKHHDKNDGKAPAAMSFCLSPSLCPASKIVPTAPTAAASVGVAMPASIEPSTDIMRKTAQTVRPAGQTARGRHHIPQAAPWRA